MLRFISIGSGSSGNCYYLTTGSDSLFIDAGVGIRTLKKHMIANGIDPRNGESRILVTHDHADHIKSVGYMSEEYCIPVYAISEVHTGIVRNCCVHKKVPKPMVNVLNLNERIQIGSFCVTPFAVPHDSAGNVGYRIEAEGVVFCLMTDVGHITEEMQTYIGEANYLVIEANYEDEMLRNGTYPQYLKERISSGTGHLSNHACGEAIANYGTAELRHVWLCHLSEENNHPTAALKTVEGVLRSYGLIAGKDFQLEVLKRRVPSEFYDLTI